MTRHELKNQIAVAYRQIAFIESVKDLIYNHPEPTMSAEEITENLFHDSLHYHIRGATQDVYLLEDAHADEKACLTEVLHHAEIICLYDIGEAIANIKAAYDFAKKVEKIINAFHKLKPVY